jgi:hypothetical protein
MAFTKLKLRSGFRVRVDLSKVSHFAELPNGTEINFNDGSAIEVEESFQTVSNRADKADSEASGE